MWNDKMWHDERHDELPDALQKRLDEIAARGGGILATAHTERGSFDLLGSGQIMHVPNSGDPMIELHPASVAMRAFDLPEPDGPDTDWEE